MSRFVGRARPRVGLLGNPSDLFGGRVVSFTFDAFVAEAALDRGDALDLEPLGPAITWSSAEGLAALVPQALRGGEALLAAAARRFVQELAPWNDRAPARLSFRSDLPRQVGLSGSSAIVIAAQRALAAAGERALEPLALAGAALRAETQELGITAGPQDRTVQACGGLCDMDFRTEPPHVRRLDPRLLPPLFLAYLRDPGAPSGQVHDPVRARWEAGDPGVVATLERFRANTESGLRALEERAPEGLAEAIARNFELRASLWDLAARDVHLVELARRAGAVAKYCGSGGAVVGMARDGGEVAPLAAAYRAAGCAFLEPTVESFALGGVGA